MKLETKVKHLTAHLSPSALFNVQAYEMTHDGEGWSVNAPFPIASGVTREELPGIVRGRWEVIAANYGRKSVSAMRAVANDHGYGPQSENIAHDKIPIVAIFPAR